MIIATKHVWSRETITELQFSPTDPVARKCACCGGRPGLYELDRNGTVTKMVNCETASISGGLGLPEPTGVFMDACPMFSPGMGFNRATRKDAIDYWNETNDRIEKLRNENGACS